MKTIYIFNLVCIIIITTICSCNDFLEVEPSKRLDTNYWKTSDDAEKALIGAYKPLQIVPNQRNFDHLWQIGDCMSDDSRKGGGTNQDQGWLYDFQLYRGKISDSEVFIKFWNFIYEGVRHTSMVINNVAVMPDEVFSDGQKDRIIAEAKFLRGFYYFVGINLFGETIPLITEVMEAGEESNKEIPFARPNAIPGEIYDQIEKDLKEAIPSLPWIISKDNQGRATKGAAIGMLAKVSIWRGKWQQAWDNSNLLIQEGPYDLFATKYENLWDCDYEHNSNSIWEINYTPTGTGEPRTGTMASIFMNPRNTWGYGFNFPSLDLYNSYEYGDPRRSATIISWGDTIIQGLPPVKTIFRMKFDPKVVGNKAYYVEKEDGSMDKSIGYGTAMDIRKKGFDHCGTVANIDSMMNRKYYLPLKYIPNQYGMPQNQGETNIRYLQIAEVYLFRAEASYHLSNESQAKEDLKAIRSRAKLSIPSNISQEEASLILPESIVDNASGDELLKLIYKERRIELAMEGHRYFDLMRRDLNEAKNILDEYIKSERKFIEDGVSESRWSEKYRVLPFPQSEITKSGGLMVQPNGW